MPPFRIPFTSKRPTVNTDSVTDENARPTPNGDHVTSPYTKDKPSLALGLKERKDEPNEFKLSCKRIISHATTMANPNSCQRQWRISTCELINTTSHPSPPTDHSQPSPTEKKSFWAKSPATGTTNHRICFNEHEPFSISRESFESYRRSFVSRLPKG